MEETSLLKTWFATGIVVCAVILAVIFVFGGLGQETGTVDAQWLISVTATPGPALTATPVTFSSIEELMVFLADDDPFLGPEDAPVTIIEFSDYACPYCGKFYLETLPLILKAYPDEVRYVHRDYPIFGDVSFELAMSAGCAREQDKFWDLHRVYLDLFTDYDFDSIDHSKPKDPEALEEMLSFYSQEKVLELAESAGVDGDEFTECMEDQRYADEVIYDYQIGAQIGIQGIPFFVINGVAVSGAQPFEVFVQVIEQSLG